MSAHQGRSTARFGLSGGQVVGSYKIIEELGGGGMGMVYVAEHALLGRRAAVKVLRPDLTNVPAIVQRFFNEARATTAIRHPGIVEIYDFGYTADGHAYIVMELLEGLSLGDKLVRARRLPVGPALVIARRIALALAAAHERSIVHRDLKPDNVFLVRDADGGEVEQIKLLDFGIAKLTEDGAMAVDRTSTSVVLGTPLYMSPEQCRGAGRCDHRSDLYSLGCVLFEMIGGRPPFLGEGAGEVLAAHLHAAPPDIRTREPGVPPAVAALIARLLAKATTDRPASAAATAVELERLIDLHGPPRRSAAMPTVVAAGSWPGAVPPPAPSSPSIAASGERVPAATALSRPRSVTVAALTLAGIALASAGLAILRATGRFAAAGLDAGPAAGSAAPALVRPITASDVRAGEVIDGGIVLDAPRGTRIVDAGGIETLAPAPDSDAAVDDLATTEVRATAPTRDGNAPSGSSGGSRRPKPAGAKRGHSTVDAGVGRDDVSADLDEAEEIDVNTPVP